MDIQTEITIEASVAEVWEVLTAFENYEKWNPFVKYVKGNVAVGNKIEVKLKDMTFKPRVLAYSENREFRWLGHLGFKGIFDGEHRFLLIDNGDGSTTLKHSEHFKGVLVGLLKNKLLNETKKDFESMNQALKMRVEKKKIHATIN